MLQSKIIPSMARLDTPFHKTLFYFGAGKRLHNKTVLSFYKKWANFIKHLWGVLQWTVFLNSLRTARLISYLWISFLITTFRLSALESPWRHLWLWMMIYVFWQKNK